MKAGICLVNLKAASIHCSGKDKRADGSIFGDNTCANATIRSLDIGVIIISLTFRYLQFIYSQAILVGTVIFTLNRAFSTKRIMAIIINS
ncbi:hypothetical protein A0U92_07490 [Acetobacter aceti]|uniref:Uncharacterized protein n=1 Tax=Acetobacter aceti TaxID=435 RepID=A0A1U9KFZ4_ACEAC|nr:hypothetical protein A0U92_07490 [Acetobacter aceti]